MSDENDPPDEDGRDDDSEKIPSRIPKTLQAVKTVLEIVRIVAQLIGM